MVIYTQDENQKWQKCAGSFVFEKIEFENLRDTGYVNLINCRLDRNGQLIRSYSTQINWKWRIKFCCLYSCFGDNEV